ncbi:MAG: hypothetical protein CVV44_14305 [Spirochaetae bacterium HGW-Spirochaetae-1]|jgi:hypothetical protein|nr:MAG: hypothetical protein CVV44_14305 [Spirochaetae bacterium HGW-Spirochaetae-1]
MKRFLLAVTAMVLALSLPVLAQDAKPAETTVGKLTYGENLWIQPHFLLQIQGNFQEDNAGSDWSKDAQIRRARIILKGSVAKDVTFFVETDAAQWDNGKNDATATSKTKDVFVQDAFIDYNIMDELKIAAGMILPAFMHHNRQSAISLLGVDYAVKTVPVGGNVWRDMGVEARGLFLDGMIDYHFGMYSGADGDTNEGDWPRLIGRLQFNFLDAETDFFYSGNYLGKKRIASIGGGVDYQNAPQGGDPSVAWTVDAYADLDGFTCQAAYVQVSHSQFATIDKSAFVEAGYLFEEFMVQPVVRYYYADDNTLGEISYIYGGLNYYINKHNANLKAEFGYPLMDSDDMVVNVQAQIFI